MTGVTNGKLMVLGGPRIHVNLSGRAKSVFAVGGSDLDSISLVPSMLEFFRSSVNLAALASAFTAILGLAWTILRSLGRV